MKKKITKGAWKEKRGGSVLGAAYTTAGAERYLPPVRSTTGAEEIPSLRERYLRKGSFV